MMSECLICSGKMKPVNTSINTNWGGKKPLTVSGIPAEQCETCGEVVLSIEAARLIQSISRGFADGVNKDKPDFLALPEVAELLRVSHQTIYNMVRDGRLRAQKAGREWRFRREDLAILMEPQVALAARAEKLTEPDKSAVAKRLARSRNKVHVS